MFTTNICGCFMQVNIEAEYPLGKFYHKSGNKNVTEIIYVALLQ